ncbi:hypothetical protein [Spiroplasma apis]|uniref:Uncharacterized protein n=1 Tax=Spiroplasma apis B31 TaxID=1276258 RepID=V5RIN4_SPIAP|nr:hypothetical protein [Spiroplasma apis]AHB36424.1 hypothetical protein SAPIS_v1c05790 [Spiroplasma apis B31]
MKRTSNKEEDSLFEIETFIIDGNNEKNTMYSNSQTQFIPNE